MITRKHVLNINEKELLDISEFVVRENFKHHMRKVHLHEYNKDIAYVFNEEINYLNNSQIFKAKIVTGEIVGTIRVLKWDLITPLPIQKIFGIDPTMFASKNSINEIFHIGRFAIKKGAHGILKKLMISAIRPICKNNENIAFAECDAKLLQTMRLMGIEAEVIGRPVNYLGSETIPIILTYDGLIDFYNKNNKNRACPNEIDIVCHDNNINAN